MTKMTEKLDLVLELLRNIQKENTREHDAIKKRLDHTNGGFKIHEDRLTKIESVAKYKEKLLNRNLKIWAICIAFITVIISTLINILGGA